MHSGPWVVLTLFKARNEIMKDVVLVSAYGAQNETRSALLATSAWVIFVKEASPFHSAD